MNNPKQSKRIKEIKSDGTEIVYSSLREAERQTGAFTGNIVASIKRGGTCRKSK